ncbi:MAG: hypothetical protein IPL33_16755 [Sphingobacteriales bacterium]|nr:hypothetical protein [Sphingobacteriales bacterium]
MCARLTLNGLNSNSIELSECGTQTIILNYEGLDIPLSVAIPETQLDGSELQLTAEVSHSHSNCGDDICDGAVTVAVSGTGSGQYEYEWSDGCQWHPTTPQRAAAAVCRPTLVALSAAAAIRPTALARGTAICVVAITR